MLNPGSFYGVFLGNPHGQDTIGYTICKYEKNLTFGCVRLQTYAQVGYGDVIAIVCIRLPNSMTPIAPLSGLGKSHGKYHRYV